MNAELFDLETYLNQFDPELLETKEGRRIYTRTNPLLFALLYRLEGLSDVEGNVTFADLHLDLAEQAKQWIVPNKRLKGARDIYVAPRECGKSTWLFNILMLWAAAHGHVKLVAAFSHGVKMAQKHFTNFKTQVETNKLLRYDFPELCTPLKGRRGFSVADTNEMYRAKSGFTMAAFGIDNVAVGLNINDQRPDVILLDDVEPDEGNYSAYQATQRLATIRTAILPMNNRARVIMVGTVLMPGSLIHQAVKAAKGIETAEWIKEENFRVHHYKPIITRDDGTERSCWPGKWSMEELNAYRFTRDFRMTFDNDPMAYEDGLFDEQDFTYGEIATATRFLVSIDPAVTDGKKSDYTGIAVISHSKVENRCVVHLAEQVKLHGEALRAHVYDIVINKFPQVKAILVETNQGGLTWESVFHHLPPGVTLVAKHNTVKKEVRAANLLAEYQARPRPRVIHAVKLTKAEEQLVAFPRAENDDIVDAIGNGVHMFLHPDPVPQRVVARAVVH